MCAREGEVFKSNDLFGGGGERERERKAGALVMEFEWERMRRSAKGWDDT